MNRTIMNMVRSMMFFKNFKLMFWSDAMICAIYLRNRSRTHALEKKTLHEMWYGLIYSMRHLMIFGSTCYELIPKEKRDKHGARSQKFILLGYSNTSKAYRLCVEVNMKFTISRDVVFLEVNKNK